MVKFYYNERDLYIREVKDIYYNNNGTIIKPSEIYYNDNGTIINLGGKSYTEPTIMVEGKVNSILGNTQYGYAANILGDLLKGIDGYNLQSVEISTGGQPFANLFQVAWKGDVLGGNYDVYIDGVKVLSNKPSAYNQFGHVTSIAVTESLDAANFKKILDLFIAKDGKEMSFNLIKL